MEQYKTVDVKSQSEERPTALRSNIVEKYMKDIFNKNNGDDYQQKLKVVRKMHELNMDNRVLNNMRQTMNEQIDDERGLMKADDFKRMFFTAYRAVTEDKKQTVFNMLLPLIMPDRLDMETEEDAIRTKFSSSKRLPSPVSD